MTVVLYTTSTCPYCKQEAEYLESQKIPYTKIVLDQQPEKLEEFRQVSPGFSGVPLTVITDDGKTTVVRGFNRSDLDNVLGLTKSPAAPTESASRTGSASTR